MELSEIVKQIKERWSVSNRKELIIEFDKAPQYAGSGLEGLVLMGNFLLQLRQKDLEAYNEIQDLVDEYIKMSLRYNVRFLDA